MHAEKPRQRANVEGGARKGGTRDNLPYEVGEILSRADFSYVEATRGGRRKTKGCDLD